MQAIPRTPFVRVVVIPVAVAIWLSACSATSTRQYNPRFDPSGVGKWEEEHVTVWEKNGVRTELRSAWIYGDSIRGWESKGPGSTNVGELHAIPLDGV